MAKTIFKKYIHMCCFLQRLYHYNEFKKRGKARKNTAVHVYLGHAKHF